MTRDEQIEAVERDRKKREAGLLALLLAFGEAARLNVVRSIRVGAAWASVLRGVLLGDERIDQRGGVPVLARVMADSHAAGYRRVGRILDVPLPTLEVPDEIYRPAAERTLNRIADGLETAVKDELSTVAEADRISVDAKAVGEAFAKYAWTPETAVTHKRDAAGNWIEIRRGAATEASRVVLQGYAAGMHAGYKAPPAALVMTGLRFTNPLDASTTNICRPRAGVTLPLDHPWWFRNWSPLHYGCRSMQLPTTRKVTYTANPPNFPPPAPGFGSNAGMLVGGAWG